MTSILKEETFGGDLTRRRAVRAAKLSSYSPPDELDATARALRAPQRSAAVVNQLERTNLLSVRIM